MGSCTAGGRLCPRHVGRERDRPQSGHDLPRRAAAGEGGDGGRKSAPRIWAAAICTRRNPAWSITWRRMTSTRSPSCAISSPHCAPRAGGGLPRVARGPRLRGASPRHQRTRAPPKFDAEDLYALIPEDVRAPYDVKEVIARLGRRAASFTSFKAHLRLHAGVRFRPYLGGMPVAILANNGVLFSESAQKGAHFIELACQRRHSAAVSSRTSPASWSAGNTRRKVSPSMAQKLVTAVATATVPKVTVVIGGSFGAGNYGMCGAGILSALPVHLAQCAHLGDGRGAGGIRARHRSPRRRQVGRTRGRSPSRRRSARNTRTKATPTDATARLWDDGVVDPAQTRDVLGLALAACLEAPIAERPAFGVFRM